MVGWRTAVGVLGAVLLASTCGCNGGGGGGGSSSERPADPVPAIVGRGPGSPIVGGIEVVEGSVLLGTAFPQAPYDRVAPDDGTSARSWRAEILVQGDPAVVYDAYAQQLAQTGVGLTPGYVNGPCADIHGGSFRGLDDLDAGARGFPIECSAYGDRGQLYLWHTAAAGPWASHIVLTFRERGPEDPAGPVPVDLDVIGPTPGLLSDAREPPAAPGTGEQIAPRRLDPMTSAVRVIDGTTALAPAAPGESVTGGYVSVAKVTGDPEVIVDAYVQQGKYPGEIFADTYEANGHPVIQKWWDNAGGPKLYVTATTDDQGEWFVMIDVSND